MRRTNPTQDELLFHWYRVGNRDNLARLYRVNTRTITRSLPVTNEQLFMRGQMVNIGGILAKRCNGCGTARELERFIIDEARASGCRAYCDKCRENGLGR